MEQRQCDFAFAEVVACGFADILILEIIKYVVADLEAQSEIVGEPG